MARLVATVPSPATDRISGSSVGYDPKSLKGAKGALTVIDLARAFPGVRALDAGPLENSRIVEQLTALLVSLNIRYGVKTAGLRITGVQSKN